MRTLEALAQEPTSVSDRSETDRAQTARIEILVAAYAHWHGTFADFCGHVQQQLRIPYGRTLVASILARSIFPLN